MKSLPRWLFLAGISFFSFNAIAQSVTQRFPSSGTFVVPPGVTSITVKAWGAGGGGGERSPNNADAGGGGGGGGYAGGVMTVTPLSTITVTVGTGGVGAIANGANGTAGGNSIVTDGTSTVTATGGGFGTSVNGGGAGGAGGTATFAGTVASQVTRTGGAGAGANTGANFGGGGGGGAGDSGNGGAASGTTAGTAGTGSGGAGGGGSNGGGGAGAGSLYGGGGGGASDTGSSVAGNGADGQVIVTYTLPTPNGSFYTANFLGGCAGNGAVFSIQSSFFPTDAAYTVTYSVTGANTIASTTASLNFTAGSPGSGNLTTATLSTAGSNTIQVTQIQNSNGNYTVTFSPSSNNTFSIVNCNTWYSYQSGTFNDFNTWTRDPSGTTFDNPGSSIPQAGDDITILNGFTVTFDASSKVLSSVTIEGGGIVDLGTTTGHILGVVTGTGKLRLKGVNLPNGTYTDFVTTLGGTIEYYDVGGNLPTSQTTYNKLLFTNSTGSNITYVLISNLTANGTVTLSTTGAGTVNWQINDGSNNRRTIVLNDDLTVAAGGRINVGTGNEASSTPHALTMYGNINNSGIIKFYDSTDPELAESDYGLSYPTAGIDLHRNELQGNAVTVTFRSTANRTITCNNTTDFYRLEVNMGTGQIAKLTVSSANTSYFRLFGPANLGSGSGTAPNQYSDNALSIINGIFELTGFINIPFLNLASGNDYFSIPQNGQLWLNGANVAVTLSDSDPTHNNPVGYRLMLSGTFRVTDGTFNSGVGGGIGSEDGGSYFQEGGTVNTWQFRPRAAGTGIFSFNMTGGTFNVGYGFPVGGGFTNNTYARFDLSSANSTFQMSGGTLNIAKPANGNGLFRVGSSAANYNVTGGTVNFYMGIENGTNSYTGNVSTTAPLYNVNIFEETATAQNLQLSTALVVLNNLSIDGTNNPVLVTSNFAVTVGGNFTINSGGTYSAGTSVTTFNGSGAQTWTHSGTISALASVVMNKSAGTLTLAGTQGFPAITAALTLTSGTLADGGKTLVVSGTGVLTNSATHSGTGVLSYQSTAGTIQGTGGTFGNLSISTSATIATAGNQTVTGTLRLLGANTILNIGVNSLTALGGIFSDGTTGTAFSATKMIQTNGFHNAGGLTRQGTSLAVLFPVGSNSTYTPCSIQANATTFGTITVRPVNSEHPNVGTSGQSLKYYWRVTTSGYVGVSGTITHNPYTFSSTGLLTGTLTAYRSARYDPSSLTWSTNATTYDATSTTSIPSFTNTNLSAGSVIDGEYTCGNSSAFIAVQAYYSKGNGAWNAATGVWTASPTHVGADLAGPPCATCPVIIGDGASINHTITIDRNGRTCGTLSINTGSTLDASYYSSLNFGTNTGGAVSGRGTLRIATANFPAGDFTNFLGASGGTVEWYLPFGELTGSLAASSSTATGMVPGSYTNVAATSTSGLGTGALFNIIVTSGTAISTVIPSTPGVGYASTNTVTFNASLFGGTGTVTRSIGPANIVTTYTIPTTGPTPQNLSLANYYNLILNPDGGRIINLPASSLNVYNNWTQQTGTGTVQSNTAGTLTVGGNMAISSGTFSLTATGNQAITVNGSTTVAGTFNTTGGTHTFSTQGGITNTGTISFGSVALTFTGTSNVTFGGTATGTTLSTVTVNKGTTTAPTVTFSVGGPVTTTATTTGWLTITNGTFDWATNNTTSLSTQSYTINPTARLRVSNGTLNTTSGDDDTYDLFLNGTLNVTGGTCNVGNTTVNGFNVDIEYGSAGVPAITVSGGALWVKGSIRRSSSTITGALAYNQSGGTVTVGGISSSDVNDRGVFEIDGNTGSSFTVSGTSSLTVQRQTGGTGYADLYLNPITSSVSSGSTITVGLSTVTTNNNFRINVAPTIGNFSIAGTNAHTVNMFSNPLVVGGTLTIPSPSVLNTNSLNVSIAGDLTCAGTYTGGTNNTIFNGTGGQAGQLSATSTFNDFTVNKTTGTTLTLSGTSPTLQNLYILGGTLNVGSLNLDIRRNITNNSSQTGSGSLLINSTTALSNTINSSNGTFTNLTLGGAATSKTITVIGNATIQGTLAFPASGTRYLYIGSYQLTFDQAGTISNASSTRYIKTNGVSSDLGVVKTWATGTSTFVFQVGSSTYYTPVSYSLNVTGSGTLTVIPVNSVHPTYNQTATDEILQYYWTVRTGATLAATASASHTYSYSSSLLTCSVCSGSPKAAYLNGASNPLGWTTSGHGGTATTTLMTYATTPSSNLPSPGNYYDYSVGTSNSLPNPILPLYSRKGLAATVGNTGVGGSWAAASNWTTDTDGDLDQNNASTLAPSGVPVVILPGTRINTATNGKRAYKTTINGLLNNDATTGHNLGTISGTGTFRTATNTFPAGDYTAFVSSSGGTIEYVAPMTMNSRSQYNNLSIQSGSAGTVTMTNTDLTLAGSLTIPSGTTLNNANNRNITLSGNWSNAGTFTPGTGTVTFAGTTGQSVTGNNTFYDLTINNSGGNITLSGAASNSVSHLLTLTSGKIITSATNILSLGNANVSGGSASSYISGPMTKIIAAGGSFLAPVGSVAANRYRPATIASTSASDTWSFQYNGYNPSTDSYNNLTMNTANIRSVSQYEYWLISRLGSTTASLTLSYDVGSYTPPNIGTLTDLRVARWETSVPWWDVPPGSGTHTTSGTNIAGTVTVTNVTSFSPVTLASIVTPSPLPIQLVSFTGTIVTNGVQLDWKTLTEVNNDRFEIEKSIGGEKFTMISKVAGHGTTLQPNLYQYVDSDVAPGRSYYRLRQVDHDGKFSYSNVIYVDFIGRLTFTAYPNPVSGKEINFKVGGIDGKGQLSVQLYDQLGRIQSSLTFQADDLSGSFVGTLPIDNLANGVYFLRIGGTNIVSKVVVNK